MAHTSKDYSIIIFLLGLAAMVHGCAEDQLACTKDPDCPADQRCADGRCTPSLKLDSSWLDQTPEQTSPPAGDATADGKKPAEGSVSDATTAKDGWFSCTPNNDDQITRQELPITVGAKVTYSVGNAVQLNLAGTMVNGHLQWDLTQNGTDEHQMISELQPVFSWAAASFPQATYLSLLDEDLGAFGIFRVTNSALQLEGVISEQASQTKLIYSTPVDLLRFPLIVGNAWASEATVTGSMNWIPLWLSEKYSGEVLMAGNLKLPLIELPVLLVKVQLQQTPVNPLLATTSDTFFFVTECYGIVARVMLEGTALEPLGVVTAKERWRIDL